MFSMAGFLQTFGHSQLKSRGPIVKGLHIANAALFLLNALLWALVTKQPVIAVLWLAVGLGELYVVTKTDLLST